VSDLLRVALLGGLLGLDGTSVGQFMVSRPLVAGVLTGWVLGEPALGLAVGAILELYLLVSFPTGGSKFPEGSTATVVAVAAATSVQGTGAIPIAIGIGLVWGQLGGATVSALRHVNSHLVPEDSDQIHAGTQLSRAHGLAIALDFVRGGAVTAMGTLVGRFVLLRTVDGWPVSDASSTGLLLVGGAVSAGILLHDLGGFRRRRLWFAAGIALGIIGTRFL
jgi:mannose/fructose/N-acetylgalactosamine-specific phosphotransferase system component IIC